MIRSVDVVRQQLSRYVERGIFRGFSETRTRAGRYAFRFGWLGPRPLNLTYENRTKTLTFRNLLPGMPARSGIYKDLKVFLQQRSDPKLPEHRRVDRRLAELSCYNRLGNVSIVLRVKGNHPAYGVTKLLNVVHEIFLLLHSSYATYTWEHFDVPQE